MYDPTTRTFTVNVWTYKNSFFERLLARRARRLASRGSFRF
ncbi:hypothetical protein [Raoultibacter phocaeensis]|nr:hypothetical protein [Raoultibacter phocaeensis]